MKLKCKITIWVGLGILVFSAVTLGLYLNNKADDYYDRSKDAKTSKEVALLIKSDFIKPSNEKKNILIAQHLALGDTKGARNWMQKLTGPEKFTYLAGLLYETNNESAGGDMLNKITEQAIKNELIIYKKFLKGEKTKEISNPITDYGKVINYFVSGDTLNTDSTYSYLGSIVGRGVKSERDKVALAKKVLETSPGLSLLLSQGIIDRSPLNKEALILKKDSLLLMGNKKEALNTGFVLIQNYPEEELILDVLALAKDLKDPEESKIEQKYNLIKSTKKAQ